MTWLFFTISFLVFSGGIGLRHYWFQTSAWDLGIFDQAIYLISQGLTPHSSFLGFHILGDHGALVLYPIGFLSILVPNIYLIFILQSAALASAVFPLSKLAKKNRLTKRELGLSLLVLLLYPLVFNVAIFDFHPEVIAFPLIMEALVLLNDSEPKSYKRLFIYLILAMTCKITIAILVIGIGSWLYLNKRKQLGFAIFGLGVIWFTLVGSILIPAYGGEAAKLSRHFGKFGLEDGSLLNIDYLTNTISKLTNQFLSLSNIEYLILLILPVLYLLLHRNRKRILLNLLPFTPLLLLNLLSSKLALKDLVHQYSLFLVPFIAIEVQNTLNSTKEGIFGYPNWMRRNGKNLILFWAVLMFLVLSRFNFFFGEFQNRLNTAKDRREAIVMVNPNSNLLTSNDLAPHLSRRESITITNIKTVENLNQYEQILLDRSNPGWGSSSELIDDLTDDLKENSNWEIIYQKNSIVLFNRSQTK